MNLNPSTKMNLLQEFQHLVLFKLLVVNRNEDQFRVSWSRTVAAPFMEPEIVVQQSIIQDEELQQRFHHQEEDERMACSRDVEPEQDRVTARK
ncbi:hypothetical protein pipiens_008537 [Culex pipiens pipiens]|uniref:Uncharacterized protein n=1 Tax=Culex pipiens pipiens TaxID=38569 RepID=A0ABD1DH14_CULPP